MAFAEVFIFIQYSSFKKHVKVSDKNKRNRNQRTSMKITVIRKIHSRRSLDLRKRSKEVAGDTTLVRISKELCIEVLVTVKC